jgi:hypothetical protein
MQHLNPYYTECGGERRMVVQRQGSVGQLSLRVMTPVIIVHPFSGSDDVRDVVIGMSDGLKVPFALVADISGALTFTHIWNYLRA